MAIKEPKTLADFEAELAQVHMRGQWQYDEMLQRAIGGPKPAGIPYVWKWTEVHEKLLEACQVMPESFTARRNISFMNPGLERGPSTHTIAMGMQMIRPGEIAWSHRHSIAALRFVIQGHPGIRTVVDGEPCPMEDYDLILTPRWTWHDHVNATDHHAIWLDVLDIGVVLGLNATFYEPYGEAQQPERTAAADQLQQRIGLVRPAWERPKLEHLPMRYPWREVEPRLQALSALPGSPYDGAILEYANPVTGGPTLPSLDCCVQALRPGEETKSHRHTSSAAYFVVRGEGKTVVGDTELEWGQHDAFVVPNWAWHQHLNRSKDHDAVLFSVNDAPVLEYLGLYREEPESTLRTAEPPLVPASLIKKS